MEKKNLNVYEAPAVEVVEVEAQSVICASTSVPNVNVEEPEWD